MIAAGYDNGDVKMWDLRNMKLYWDTNVGNGVFSLEYNRRDIKVSTFKINTLFLSCHCYAVHGFFIVNEGDIAQNSVSRTCH